MIGLGSFFPHGGHIAVCTCLPEKKWEAECLAAKLGLPYLNMAKETPSPYAFLLLLTEYGLGIIRTSDKKPTPFYIDFEHGALCYRRHQASLRKEMLARAIGRKPGEGIRILDATAGFGHDGFMLAALGFEVCMVERSPVVYALLADALRRAKGNMALSNTLKRLTLFHEDAIVWLAQHAKRYCPDVVYLDPMFPLRKKSAAVKKGCKILQSLVGEGPDPTCLLAKALAHARRRVIVKRPRLAVAIPGKAPQYSLFGKTIRFDIYVPAP